MANPTVLVPLAQGCEELEAVTITDLLTRAEFEVVTVGLDAEPVKASRGMVLMPDKTLDEVMSDYFDLMVLPGGLPGADNLRDDARILQKLRDVTAQGKYVAAICAAPKVLVEASLLSGKKITCYPASLDEVDTTNIEVVDEAVVIDGNVVTSRGPGTAMDFALTLIEILDSKEKREQVEQGLVR